MKDSSSRFFLFFPLLETKRPTLRAPRVSTSHNSYRTFALVRPSHLESSNPFLDLPRLNQSLTSHIFSPWNADQIHRLGANRSHNGLSTEADMIKHQMQKDTWGYVIYRTTYLSDDADWSEFLRRLRLRMEDAFVYYNGRDILEQFTLTVFRDSSLFDGADTPTIRAHFWQWAETAFRADQQPQDRSGVEKVRMGSSPRDKFCVLVALHSVVHDAPGAARDRRYQEVVGEAHQQDLYLPSGGPENPPEPELPRVD